MNLVGNHDYVMVDVARPQVFDEFGGLVGYIAVVVRLHKQHGGVPLVVVAMGEDSTARRFASSPSIGSPTEDRNVEQLYMPAYSTPAASASEARARPRAVISPS